MSQEKISVMDLNSEKELRTRFGETPPHKQTDVCTDNQADLRLSIDTQELKKMNHVQNQPLKTMSSNDCNLTL